MISKLSTAFHMFTETLIDTDYSDDLELLVNTPAQSESLLHNLKQAARGIGLYMNANKVEYMRFK